MSKKITTEVGIDGLIELDGIGEHRTACVIDDESLAVITYTETNEDGNLELEPHLEGFRVQVVIP